MSRIWRLGDPRLEVPGYIIETELETRKRIEAEQEEIANELLGQMMHPQMHEPWGCDGQR
jgi:hypothetical protein